VCPGEMCLRETGTTAPPEHPARLGGCSTGLKRRAVQAVVVIVLARPGADAHSHALCRT
jgi:hypothetical protein